MKKNGKVKEKKYYENNKGECKNKHEIIAGTLLGKKKKSIQKHATRRSAKLKEYRRSYELAKNNFFVMHSIRVE